jgi:membrane-bound metal-dependent hydrolase YbcI (DUF457 family)
MFAVGHLAIGYLTAKVFQKVLKTEVNLPLVFLLSLIPDVDLLVRNHVHRGPTHSLIVMSLVFIPIALYYRKRCVPYFAALVQHSLIGDFLTSEGARLFWPLDPAFYGVGISMHSLEGISLEWLSFLVAMVVLAKSGDLKLLLKPRKTNLLLTVPVGVIWLSAVMSFGQDVPLGLLIPHLVFLAVFALSILNLARRFVEKSI